MAPDHDRAAEEFDSHHIRLQLLFDHMLEGYAYCRMIFDSSGEPEDFVYLDVNPAFERLTGLSDVVGRRVTDVIPGIKQDNPEVLETYGRVVTSGEIEEFETSLESLDLVLRISAFRPEPGHFVAMFEDITERSRAEQKMQALVKFLEYRVRERTDELAEAMGLIDSGTDSK